jgi:hypothetical protein
MVVTSTTSFPEGSGSSNAPWVQTAYSGFAQKVTFAQKGGSLHKM